MRTFKMGDRVRVIRPHCRDTGYVGTVTSFVKFGREYRVLDNLDAWFLDEELAPAYDGYQAARWSDCAWQPNKVTA